jgi:hypothetical protein
MIAILWFFIYEISVFTKERNEKITIKLILSNIHQRGLSILVSFLVTGFFVFVTYLVFEITQIFEFEFYEKFQGGTKLLFQIIGSIILIAAILVVICLVSRLTAKDVLDRIDDKYKQVSANSTQFLNHIFQLNNGMIPFSVAHNIFFNNLLNSYFNNSRNNRYFIPVETYYDIIKTLIENGYEMKSLNGMLLPFWYVPKEKNEALEQYIQFFKNKKPKYNRITYYQDDNWKDNTIEMIYLDLLNSENGQAFAIRWLITLVAKIKFNNQNDQKFEDLLGRIKNIFGNLDLQKGIDYLHRNDDDFANKINDFTNESANMEKFTELVTANSQWMTEAINTKFAEEMKHRTNSTSSNTFKKKGEIDKNIINLDIITEVGYFENGKEIFIMLLNGNNTGSSVEIEIIKDTKKIENIKGYLLNLIGNE